jgi:hypothetical protein
MSAQYGFINTRTQPYAAIKNQLDLGRNAASKFDMLNAHVLNTVVVPGELIIIGDASTAHCTSFEASLMAKATEIHWALLANGAGGDGFILDNYEMINSLLGHSALGIGAVSGAWGKRLNEVQTTLGDIDDLFKKSLGANSILSRNEFITRRRVMFDQLDRQLKGFVSFGTGLRNEGSIKRMLGVSTNSYIHQGEIAGYAEKIAGIARAAKYMKAGGYVGIALNVGAAGLSIHQACSLGRESECTKAKYVEGSKLAGSLMLGSVTGGLGGLAGSIACAVAFGIVTGGLGALACIIIGSAAGGLVGGNIGSWAGETAGTILFESIELD